MAAQVSEPMLGAIQVSQTDNVLDVATGSGELGSPCRRAWRIRVNHQHLLGDAAARRGQTFQQTHRL